MRVPESVFALDEYRMRARSEAEYRGLLVDGARRIVEASTFPHERASRSDTVEHIERLIERLDGPDGSEREATLSKRIIQTGSPLYRRAFGKYLVGKPLTSEEARALSLTTTEGGYAVPYTLDPTVIPTSNGVVNPLRSVSRVVTITSNEWRGVSSEGITASYGAEGAEATDNAPGLLQPTANPERAQAFIPFSREIGDDWGSLETEMARLLQDAKDDLEADKFLTGLGHSSVQPEGLLVGGTAYANTAATATFAVADLYTLEEALPPRFRPRARVIGNRAQFNRVRQFDTQGGASLWVRLDAANPPELIGYPAHELSSMASTITTGSSILTIGDFSHFLIVDRVGMSVELIPHLFGGTANYPTGQRGLFAYWRNTTDVLAWQAFRTLVTL